MADWEKIPEALQQPLYDIAMLGTTFTGKSMQEPVTRITDFMLEHFTCSVTTFYGSRNPDSPTFGPDEQCENLAVPGGEYCLEHAQAMAALEYEMDIADDGPDIPNDDLDAPEWWYKI